MNNYFQPPEVIEPPKEKKGGKKKKEGKSLKKRAGEYEVGQFRNGTRDFVFH